MQQVAGRLVGAGEPGADHHRRGAGGQRQRDVARVAHSPVGPDVLAELAGGARRTRAPRRTAAGRRRSSSGWCTSRPGPTPTLTMSAPASTSVADALGGDHVAGRDRHRRVDRARTARSASTIRSWWPWAVSTTRQSTPASSSSRGLGRDVAVDADRGGDPQAARRRRRAGRVERGAQRAGAGEHADQPAVGVDGRARAGAGPRRARRTPSRGSVSCGERDQRRRSSRRCTWANRSTLGAVGLGDHADRAAVLDHDRRPVGALGDQRQRLADGLVRGQRRSGCRRPGAATSPTRTTSATTAIGMSCGITVRPPRRATVSAIRLPAIAVMFATTSGSVAPVPSAVARSTSYRLATDGVPRHHEDVVVGQVVRRGRVVEEVHVRDSLRRPVGDALLG